MTTSFEKTLRAYPADIAQELNALHHDELLSHFQKSPLEAQAHILPYLSGTQQLLIVRTLEREALIRLITHMPPDERAHLFKRLPKQQRARLLPGLAQAEREDVLKLTSYPAWQVGSVMTSAYATLSPQMSQAQALAHLRHVAPNKETIYQSYVIDPQRRLLGVVFLKDLITATANTRVHQLMRPPAQALKSTDAKELAAKSLAEYDLLALPIVDDAYRLQGIITHDDALDVLQDKYHQDMHKASAVGILEHGLKQAPLHQLYLKRVFWLMPLALGNMISGTGMMVYQELLDNHISLIFFLPLLIGSAGNAGAQAATLVVRALATDNITLRDWARVIGKEAIVAGLLGLSMACAIAVLGASRAEAHVIPIVFVTMILNVILGGVIGALIPFILTSMRLDPAAASAPLISSLADIFGIFLYLSLAFYHLSAF